MGVEVLIVEVCDGDRFKGSASKDVGLKVTDLRTELIVEFGDGVFTGTGLLVLPGLHPRMCTCNLSCPLNVRPQFGQGSNELQVRKVYMTNTLCRQQMLHRSTGLNLPHFL